MWECEIITWIHISLIICTRSTIVIVNLHVIYSYAWIGIEQSFETLSSNKCIMLNDIVPWSLVCKFVIDSESSHIDYRCTDVSRCMMSAWQVHGMSASQSIWRTALSSSVHACWCNRKVTLWSKMWWCVNSVMLHEVEHTLHLKSWAQDANELIWTYFISFHMYREGLGRAQILCYSLLEHNRYIVYLDAYSCNTNTCVAVILWERVTLTLTVNCKCFNSLATHLYPRNFTHHHVITRACLSFSRKVQCWSKMHSVICTEDPYWSTVLFIRLLSALVIARCSTGATANTVLTTLNS